MMKPWMWKVLLSIVSVWLLSGIILYFLPNRGTFGDMFGAVNALFSGFALFGVIVAIVLQRDELKLQRKDLELQRKELELTRGEIEGQRKQLEAQSATMKKQNFEETFFHMITLYNDVVKDLKTIGRGGHPVNGRDSFGSLIQSFTNRYSEHLKVKKDVPFDDIPIIGNTFFYNHINSFGVYWNYLETLIEFLNASDMENKRLYTDIFSSQLSIAEMRCLFYYGITDRGLKVLKPFVEKYSILQNLSIKDLLDTEHRAFYDHSALLGE